jgi:outer membrane lipase/esterase
MPRRNHIAMLLAAAILAGCGGGGGSGDQSPRIKFSSQVAFGDSLSDVGTYAVGPILAAHGGQYTINGTGKNWTELMAAQLGLPVPCAAETGGFGVVVTVSAGCTGYAQGGARVTNPVGPGNGLLTGGNATSGQLTVPIVTQIQNHLATLSGGVFKGDEIVFVMAGANDVFMQLATYSAAVGAGTSSTTAAADAVAAMGTAADELAGYVNTQITGKGARFVVVINVPDIASMPYGVSQGAQAQGLIDTMVTTYNSRLQSGLAINSNVLYVDAYMVSRDEVTNPAQYGLTNVTTPACDLTVVTSSLICSSTTLIPGVVDHYLFADGEHPTPYGYGLLARLVSREMIVRGWM